MILFLKAKLAYLWRLGIIDRPTAFRWEMDRALGESSRPHEDAYFKAGIAALISLLFFGVYSLTGCAGVSVETVLVDRPVIARATPPAELTAPLTAPLPTFVQPSDPRATSALTAAGETSLQHFVLELLTRLRAWEAWAFPSEPTP